MTRENLLAAIAALRDLACEEGELNNSDEDDDDAWDGWEDSAGSDIAGSHAEVTKSAAGEDISGVRSSDSSTVCPTDSTGRPASSARKRRLVLAPKYPDEENDKQALPVAQMGNYLEAVRKQKTKSLRNPFKEKHDLDDRKNPFGSPYRRKIGNLVADEADELTVGPGSKVRKRKRKKRRPPSVRLSLADFLLKRSQPVAQRSATPDGSLKREAGMTAVEALPLAARSWWLHARGVCKGVEWSPKRHTMWRTQRLTHLQGLFTKALRTPRGHGRPVDGRRRRAAGSAAKGDINTALSGRQTEAEQQLRSGLLAVAANGEVELVREFLQLLEARATQYNRPLFLRQLLAASG